LTFFEARSHFSAWAIVSSPLTLSLDVNNDTVMDAVWEIISNKVGRGGPGLSEPPWPAFSCYHVLNGAE